jgi:multimeric flavodoxin WrbA
MQLAIFNGSPRGKSSNTKVLLDQFQKGFEESGGEEVAIDYLIRQKHLSEQVQHFREADIVFIAFPLYVFSVPGIVKSFIEEIGEFEGEGKKILFLVQSGFPEACQSDSVKKQMELLAKRWKMENLGVIVKPGAEGVRLMPEMMTKKLFKQMSVFGEQLAKNGKLNAKDLKNIASPYKYSKFKIALFRLLQKVGLTNLYWNMNLKKNDAFDKRFDVPYLNS